ncbi:MAG: hypothetical protein AABZ60_12075 [Planctomycetota bacterium]
MNIRFIVYRMEKRDCSVQSLLNIREQRRLWQDYQLHFLLDQGLDLDRIKEELLLFKERFMI